jgi:hypothetical protein
MISLTHEEIGEIVGASRETVTRTFAVFKHKQLIAQHGLTMTIPDKKALQNVAYIDSAGVSRHRRSLKQSLVRKTRAH